MPEVLMMIAVLTVLLVPLLFFAYLVGTVACQILENDTKARRHDYAVHKAERERRKRELGR